MDSERRIAALKSILRTNAQSGLVSSTSQEPKCPPAGIRIPALELTMPPATFISHHLTALPPSSASRVQQRIEQALFDLQQANLKTYTTTCQKLLASLPPARLSENLERVRSTHEKIWTRQSTALIEERLPALVTLPPTAVEKKFNYVSPMPCWSSLNHAQSIIKDFAPTLEKYFELNAFPSIDQKEALSRISNMDLRKIDVWVRSSPTL